MKRLLKRCKDGTIECVQFSECTHETPCNECFIWGDIAEKCYAYEDTGLTPEEIQELKQLKENLPYIIAENIQKALNQFNEPKAGRDIINNSIARD